jgi:hypothetical protein
MYLEDIKGDDKLINLVVGEYEENRRRAQGGDQGGEKRPKMRGRRRAHTRAESRGKQGARVKSGRARKQEG